MTPNEAVLELRRLSGKNLSLVDVINYDGISVVHGYNFRYDELPYGSVGVARYTKTLDEAFQSALLAIKSKTPFGIDFDLPAITTQNSSAASTPVEAGTLKLSSTNKVISFDNFQSDSI